MISTELLPGTATSRDGTPIGYLTIGTGPHLVIVHGAMQSATSQTDLAQLLADRFTVHLMDRRGRGASGPYPVALSTAAKPAKTAAKTDTATATSTVTEVDDLRAVLDATGAHRVLGISSGAIISARTALVDDRIERLILFEPPLSIDGSMRLDLVPRIDAAVAAGDTATVMGLAMKVSEMGPPWMFGMPVPVLSAMSRRMLRTPEVRAMAAALPADVGIVRENSDHLADFGGIAARTLILSGTKTRPFLRAAARALAEVIPSAQRIELPGQSHGVTQNSSDWGKPELVAPVVETFFG